MAPKKEEVPRFEWAKSEACAILVEALESGALSLYRDDVAVQEAFDMFKGLPEFEIVSYEMFREKLASHRRQIIKQLKRSEVEEAAMIHDRQLFPVQMHNAQGTLRYDVSATHLSLREDVLAGKHKIMTAAALRATRPEYQQEYDGRKFAEHLRQEVRRAKFLNYLNQKREEEKEKKQEALAKARAERPAIKAMQEEAKRQKEAERNGKRMRK